ncbi:uncharacterized protein MKK02DRAFT_41138 [Dioszegia hungarica]|uniref:Uncharacterized protein n=1 Tax=Dioszegia hungarica TaxID=4972 RepID=A0AA38H363_9TREE|nr:uncharacterized protein MKK02DRAFT_41138 [Dioszegia hungarica]KAI9632826.1 hypothetical protein MKK02DRAFT_41138 [Dioszegia hungarica]
MTYLTPHLGFADTSSGSSTAAALPPAGTHLLITDTLESPGHFASYHLIIWVDFRGEGRTSWETVLKKLGTLLPPPPSPLFVHITPSALDLQVKASPVNPSPKLFDGSTPTLRATYDAISSGLSAASGPAADSAKTTSTGSSSAQSPLVILDGLAELLWIGFTPIAIAQFVRATLALARKTNSSLVSTLHADHLPLTAASPSSSSASPSADLLDRLIRLGGGGWWRVSNLSSGRSGDVHGEISSHPLYPPGTGSYPDVPAHQPLQYRLEASTVRVFPKGTGRGFL